MRRLQEVEVLFGRQEIREGYNPRHRRLDMIIVYFTDTHYAGIRRSGGWLDKRLRAPATNNTEYW
jgi:hypothetical protein